MFEISVLEYFFFFITLLITSTAPFFGISLVQILNFAERELHFWHLACKISSHQHVLNFVFFWKKNQIICYLSTYCWQRIPLMKLYERSHLNLNSDRLFCLLLVFAQDFFFVFTAQKTHHFCVFWFVFWDKVWGVCYTDPKFWYFLYIFDHQNPFSYSHWSHTWFPFTIYADCTNHQHIFAYIRKICAHISHTSQAPYDVHFSKCNNAVDKVLFISHQTHTTNFDFTSFNLVSIFDTILIFHFERPAYRSDHFSFQRNNFLL